MAKANMARIEETMRLALAFAEAFNAHDVAALTQAMHSDCRFESSDPAPNGTVYLGIEAIQQHWHQFFQTYPQAQMEAEEVFGLGLRSVMRWRLTGKDGVDNQGEIRGVTLFHVRNGAIYAQFSYVKG